MKKLILLLVVVFATTLAHSQIDRTGDFQPRTFDLVFSAGISTLSTAPQDRTDSTTFAPEFSFGFEWEKTRLLTQLKFNKDVHFFKWTYFQFDYKQETIKNLYLYGGLELSQIKIHHPDFSYDQPNNYREHTTNPLQLGLNLELQYKFFRNHAGIAIQFNMYKSEDELKPESKFRKDLASTLFIYF